MLRSRREKIDAETRPALARNITRASRLIAAQQWHLTVAAMKPADAFDACHGRYRGLREWLADSAGSVRSLNLENPSAGYLWRPDRSRACEYVADFERIGRRALRRPEWKGRLKLFNLYIVRGADYRRAIRLLGVGETTFEYWYRELKRAIGAEFLRTGLFPPSRYFCVR
ncbi:MAG TPA: hypothetical protein VJO53_00095 [Candidatus Acidoferrales bacterium]|nr:hypothetical protein [Candidatus Acidoferrales bacterium]